jgi:hypothetical protein
MRGTCFREGDLRLIWSEVSFRTNRTDSTLSLSVYCTIRCPSNKTKKDDGHDALFRDTFLHSHDLKLVAELASSCEDN